MANTKRKHSITFTQPTLTQQHSKDECDINKIMARYVKTGVLDHVAKYAPQYTENNEVDYHNSMNIVLRANEMFADLPSPVRLRFENDPGQFLEFVNNPDNHSQLAEMGLTNTPMSPPSDNPAPPTAPPGQQASPETPPSEPAPAAPVPAPTP